MKAVKLQQDKINAHNSIATAGKAVVNLYSLILEVFIFC